MIQFVIQSIAQFMLAPFNPLVAGSEAGMALKHVA
jgi:hypothetical protein